MRKIALKTILLGLALSTMLAGCTQKNIATVEGQFFGYNATPLAIEQTMPGGNSMIIDTLRTDSEGLFNFTVEFQDENPLFVNIRTVDNYVPLLLTPGEKVKVSSIGNLYNNYKVEGSEGSQDLHTLNMTTVSQVRSLDSLSQLLQSRVMNSDREKELSTQFTKHYVNLKRDIIRFVITNPSSMASIVPLYQPLVSGRYIFEDPSDIIYFKTISDSLTKRYPTSPYVVSLQNDVEQSGNIGEMDSTLQKALSEVEEVALPPLEMKDAEGQLRKLSDLIGKKVILLDFTSLQVPELKVRNREISEVYNEYKDKGFEIYQVSVDQNKAEWLSAVVNARIKWISVNDFQGTASTVLPTFNVTKIPSSYLIDLDGNIAASNIVTAEDLETALAKLI